MACFYCYSAAHTEELCYSLKPKPFQTDIFTLQVATQLFELNLDNSILIYLGELKAEIFMVIITFSEEDDFIHCPRQSSL